MAKKFFHNRVYNTKRNIINAIIIGVCIIGVIICFIVVSSFEGEDHRQENGNISIKNETTIEINEAFTKDIFFSKVENVDLEKIEIKYFEDITKIGRYEVIIVINDKDYTSILNVVDTKIPELTLKDVTIDKGKTYTPYDFVENCSDNSNSDCKISYYDGQDEDGNVIDYSKYTEPGNYEIKISALDDAGNQTFKIAKLTIKSSNSTGNTPPPKPVSCKYGNGTYDTNSYLLAVNVTTNNCAVSLDLYNDAAMTAKINKIMDTETTKIKKDVEALKLTGTLALNRKITAVTNTSGNGIVGYEIKMIVTINNKDKIENVVEYKVNSEGKRIFISNPYKLES